MTLRNKAVTVDRQTRQDVLDAAKYQCELTYADCTVTATEIVDVGGQLKAACKPCRHTRDTNRTLGNRLAGSALRRTR